MEKPLLVSAPLIKPIQRRRKTETRRLTGLDIINQSPDDWELEICATGLDLKYYAVFRRFNEDHPPQWITKEIASPYGGPGDTLWVRENWYVVKGFDDIKPRNLPHNDVLMKGYMADGDKPEWAGKTRPSIHMPRWFSRIELLNQDITVERLHDIKEDSVRREGAGREVRQMWLFGLDAEGRRKVYRDSFRTLWIEINGQESWDRNPWVWVVNFTLKNP